MKISRVLFAATAVALAVAAGWVIGAETVKADQKPAIIRYAPAGDVKLTGLPATVEYGDPNPTGRVTLNGQEVDSSRISYRYSYSGFASNYTYASPNLNYLGTVNVGVYVDSQLYDNVGSFELVRGDINKMEIVLDSTTIGENYYYYKPFSSFMIAGYQMYALAGFSNSVEVTYGSPENPDNENAGTGTMTFRAKENGVFYGTKIVTFTIYPADLSTVSCTLNINDNNCIYNGTGLNPIIKVTFSNNISYYVREDEMVLSNNVNVGTGTVKINGGRFSGNLTKTFNIKPADITSATIKYTTESSAAYKYMTYTGSEIKPQISELACEGVSSTMKLGRDYRITGYSNNINPGTAKAFIEGIGNYTGTGEIVFYIKDASMSLVTVDIPQISWADDDDLENIVKVTYKGKTLKEDVDYDLRSTKVESNTKIEISLIGKGNFTGTAKYTITPSVIDLSKAKVVCAKQVDGVYVEVDPPVYTYDINEYTLAGSRYWPVFKIMVKDYKGDDKVVTRYFDTEHVNNDVAGQATVKILAEAPFSKNSNSGHFTILPRDASETQITSPDGYYTGKVKKPNVYFKGTSLTEGKDYDVALDKDYGRGVTATLTFKGNYTGVRTVTYDFCANMEKAVIKNITIRESSSPDGIEIVPEIWCSGKKLVLNKDYKLEFYTTPANGSTVLEFEAIGMGDYKNLYEFSADLKPYFDDLGTFDQLTIPDYVYRGDIPVPYFDKGSSTVTMEDASENCYYPEYKITEYTSDDQGLMSITFDLSDYKLTMIKSFDIEPLSLKNAKVDPIGDHPYTGKPQTPEVTVTYNNSTLMSGLDYDVTYENNVEPGTARVTITGMNYCTDSVVVTFKISKDITPSPTATPTSAVRPTVAVPTSAVPTGATKPTGAVSPTTKPQPTGVAPTGTVPTVTGEPTGAVPTGTQPTSGVVPTVTGKPSDPTTSPDSDPTAQIMEFVKRIYIYVLDREPEEEGAAFWTDELYSFRRTGAEVGLQFIFSDEFVNRNLSNEDFVTVLYNTFFGREPEEGGFAFWTSALADGTLDRMGVANGFVYSQEWADTCASYGIRSGGLTPSVEIAPSEATYAFVERMYTTAMNRASDESGKEFWSNELSNFRYTGEQVGAMFFLSEEMHGFGLSDEEFVTRLYKTFMDREPEEGGFAFWVGYLADGGSREGAVYGFTRSEEFVNKCVEARILPY